MRNGTGLRLMTMQGLIMIHKHPNANGTSSIQVQEHMHLDPKVGDPSMKQCGLVQDPPYKNCTTFGYGAIGQKLMVQPMMVVMIHGIQ